MIQDLRQAHFKTGGGEKSTDTDVATVMSSSLLEAILVNGPLAHLIGYCLAWTWILRSKNQVELYFDDGIQQSVSKADLWIMNMVRQPSRMLTGMGDGADSRLACRGCARCAGVRFW